MKFHDTKRTDRPRESAAARGALLVPILGWALGACSAIAPTSDFAKPAPGRVVGTVFHDLDGDGVRAADEPGIPDVAVSNGRDVVTTDRTGRYDLAQDGEDATIFVIKPRDWMTPTNALGLPRFFHLHRPRGSSPLRYGGIAPTGPLPSSVDFALTPRPEPDAFEVLLFGDTQTRNASEVGFLGHDVLPEVIGTSALFGVTLGDVVFDDLSVYSHVTAAVSKVGVPWYNVHGNHDVDYDALDDAGADDTFERVFGPTTYAFDVGRAHFVVLDDIEFFRDATKNEASYRGGIAPRDLEFLANDLARVPDDRLVVLLMHIPLWEVENRAALFALLRTRSHVFTVAAHTHALEQRWFGVEDGFAPERPLHHYVAGAACGNWWQGSLDEQAIPHTTMRDGAPNGYTRLRIDGQAYTFEYKAARRPADHQMTIHVAEHLTAGALEGERVVVNVFAGSERSRVEWRIDGAQWSALERSPAEDPFILALKRAEKDHPHGGRTLNPTRYVTDHLWAAPLPAGLTAGWHLIEVRSTDAFGHEYRAARVIQIE
jgi:hypothetical protein